WPRRSCSAAGGGVGFVAAFAKNAGQAAPAFLANAATTIAICGDRIQVMNAVTLEALTDRLELADELLVRRAEILDPHDLPGRYGRVVQAVDHLLQVIGCEAVLGGDWAVWRHGYVCRVTQDLEIALPAEHIDAFLRAASVAGFGVLPVQPGRWPKVLHKDTGIQVDILPEGARPGTANNPAPTTIPHPSRLGPAGPSCVTSASPP